MNSSIAKINIDAIKHQLFDDSIVRAKIAFDFGVTEPSPDSDELQSTLNSIFEQAPSSNPLEQNFDNSKIFRAAVRTLGSNSRKWSSFLKSQSKIEELLYGYDPDQTHIAFQQGRLELKHLKACLPGQSSTSDAKAIQKWAQLLTEMKNYYEYIRDLGHAFQRMNQIKSRQLLDDTELFLCLVGYLAYPPSAWAGSSYLNKQYRHLSYSQSKLPGMGYALTSEFLRNLGWNGFKPDRHIRRLFDRWFSNQTTVCADVTRIRSLIGARSKDLTLFLKYSFLGITASPLDIPHSQVDGLVWLLGVYVEKKGKESSRNYLLEIQNG